MYNNKIKLIAGPCMAESPEIMAQVAHRLVPLAKNLGLDFYFKASYDKANRTSKVSARGPGIKTGLNWLAEIKKEFNCKILTDVHETSEVPLVAKVVDCIQIPAMLCRQTSLIQAAGKTGLSINIKKGQFLAPEMMESLAQKAGVGADVWLTERGSCFGHGDLVVDFRGLKTMAQTKRPVIMDITHSTQRPPSGDRVKSDGDRKLAPLFSRLALASGYCSGLFMEVHPNPDKALSDGPSSLSIDQAEDLLCNLYNFALRDWE